MSKVSYVVVVACSLFFEIILSVEGANASTFVVTRSDDRSAVCNSGTDCSLREAIDAANGLAGADTINFSGVASVQLAAALPDITTQMTIDGGAGVTVSGDAAHATFRVFNVTSTGNLSLNQLTITNAKEAFGGGLANANGGVVAITNSSFTFNVASITAGGAISNNGTMTLTGSTVSLNTAASEGDGIRNGLSGVMTITESTISFNGSPGAPSVIGGGGIDNAGDLTVNRSLILGNLTGGNGGGIFDLTGTLNLINSTVAFNSAFANNGGGLYNDSGATATITNCTFADGNQAVLGGGIFNGATANIQNTIVSGNTGTSAGPDVSGAFVSPMFDLIGKSDGSTGFVDGTNGNIVGTVAAPIDPMLAARANNGGPTETYGLNSTSLAINRGSNALAVDALAAPLTTDQRGAGFARINGSVVDIGAFESSAVTADPVSISGRVFTPGGMGLGRAQVTLTNIHGDIRVAMTNPFGYFNFVDVDAGESYIIGINDKRYLFRPQTVNAFDSLAGLTFYSTSPK